MRKVLGVGLVCLVLVMIAGCMTPQPSQESNRLWNDSSTPPNTIWDTNGENTPRPGWIDRIEPAGAAGALFFNGESPAAADEALAKQIAADEARQEVANFMGVHYQENALQVSENFTLRESGVDPTMIERAIMNRLQDEVVRRAQVTEEYAELRRDPQGDKWYGFAFVVWDESATEALNDGLADELEQQRRAALNQAQEQSQLVNDYFNALAGSIPTHSDLVDAQQE